MNDFRVTKTRRLKQREEKNCFSQKRILTRYKNSFHTLRVVNTYMLLLLLNIYLDEIIHTHTFCIILVNGDTHGYLDEHIMMSELSLFFVYVFMCHTCIRLFRNRKSLPISVHIVSTKTCPFWRIRLQVPPETPSARVTLRQPRSPCSQRQTLCVFTYVFASFNFFHSYFGCTFVHENNQKNVRKNLSFTGRQV